LIAPYSRKNLFSRINPEELVRPFRVRSDQCSDPGGVFRESLDGTGDPTPGRGAIVIAAGREFVSARAAFRERLFAVALEHQIGCTPDIDLGYHARKIARLRSRNV
jgi:hypothetical protein